MADTYHDGTSTVQISGVSIYESSTMWDSRWDSVTMLPNVWTTTDFTNYLPPLHEPCIDIKSKCKIFDGNYNEVSTPILKQQVALSDDLQNMVHILFDDDAKIHEGDKLYISTHDHTLVLKVAKVNISDKIAISRFIMPDTVNRNGSIYSTTTDLSSHPNLKEKRQTTVSMLIADRIPTDEFIKMKQKSSFDKEKAVVKNMKGIVKRARVKNKR